MRFPDCRGRSRRMGVDTFSDYGLLKCNRIQTPPPGKFRAEALQWYKNKKADEAWIPKVRLVDFLKGEEQRPQFNTCFKVSGTDTRTRAKGVVTMRYWCSYGPLDQRIPEDPNLPNARVLPDGQVPMRQSTQQGTSCRRGCRFHFTAIFKFRQRPDAVLIRFHHKEHVDEEGKICHGRLDPAARGKGAHNAPRISIELREEIERLLLNGHSPKEVIYLLSKDRREKAAELKPDPDGIVRWPRDMLLQLKDVLNVWSGIQKRKDNYHPEDELALKGWVEANKCQVLFYQPPDTSVTPHLPFILVFATEWMLERMATLGHRNAVAMDGTFGTNKYGVRATSMSLKLSTFIL